MRLTNLEEMAIDTDLNLSPVTSTLYQLPLMQHKFVKEEIENLLKQD